MPSAGREEAGKGVSVQGRVTGGMTGHTGSKKEVSLEWLKQQGSRARGKDKKVPENWQLSLPHFVGYKKTVMK